MKKLVLAALVTAFVALIVVIIAIATTPNIANAGPGGWWGPFRIRQGPTNGVQLWVNHGGGARYVAVFNSWKAEQQFRRRYNPYRLRNILDRYESRCGIFRAGSGRGQVWERLPLRRSIGQCQRRPHWRR